MVTETSKGNGKVIKINGDGQTLTCATDHLNGDVKALMGREEALKVNEEALEDNEEALMGEEEAVKSDGMC